MKSKLYLVGSLCLMSLIIAACASHREIKPQGEVVDALDEQIALLIEQLGESLPPDACLWPSRAAAKQLQEIGEPAIPALIEALSNHENILIRRQAAFALGWIGEPAKDAVPALIRALKGKHVGVQGSAVSALGRIGPAAHAVVPELVKALSHGENYFRPGVISVLGRIGDASDAVMSALIWALHEKRSAVVRIRAASALYRLDPSKQNLVTPVLMEILSREHVNLRISAAKALYQVDESKRDIVVSVLISALSHEKE
jgi:HEAT repeat protein